MSSDRMPTGSPPLSASGPDSVPPGVDLAAWVERLRAFFKVYSPRQVQHAADFVAGTARKDPANALANLRALMRTLERRYGPEPREPSEPPPAPTVSYAEAAAANAEF